tara:strand:- start:2025 stop:2291 length:267 start_codon:yes stop_codon:yes gene_type:complete
MKITKAQLKQIIKEELSMSINEDDESDQRAIDKVKEVITLFSKLYNELPNDESKELFEHYLNKNVEIYTKMWQKDRRPAIEEPEGEEI